MFHRLKHTAIAFLLINDIPSACCATLRKTRQVWLVKIKGIWGLQQVHAFTYSFIYSTKVPQRTSRSSQPKETANLVTMIWQFYFSSWPHITDRSGSDRHLLDFWYPPGARNCRQVCSPQCTLPLKVLLVPSTECSGTSDPEEFRASMSQGT